MAKTKTRPKDIAKVPAQEQPQPELPTKLDTRIGRVYLIKKTGPELLEGPEATESIKAILDQTKGNENGDMEYVFYEDGYPVYLAVQNSQLEPMKFPEPGVSIEKGEMGMTSMYLYALAVTLAHTIERIVELETSPKPSLIDQAKKIMTPTIVIVGCVLAIFLLAVMMKG